MITLEKIKNIIKQIKSYDAYVNDSHTKAEHNGVCKGLDMLVEYLEELERNK